MAPDQSEATGFETVDIINKTRCETKAAIFSYPNKPIKFETPYSRDAILDKKYEGIIITYIFEFISEENNNVGAGATYVGPIKLGTFSINGSLGVDKLRRGTDNITLTETFAELRQLNCREEYLQASFTYPILGLIGVDRIVWSYFQLMPTSSASTQFNRTLYFKLKKNAGLKPSISIIPVVGAKFDADIDASAYRTDSHSVTIELKGAKRDKVPTAQEIIDSKTVYVRFIDAFDNKGQIKRGDAKKRPKKPGDVEIMTVEPDAVVQPGLPAPGAGRGGLDREKENAQRDALDNKNQENLRRLRREILRQD